MTWKINLKSLNLLREHMISYIILVSRGNGGGVAVERAPEKLQVLDQMETD